MVRLLIDAQGRFMLAGGRFLSATPGGVTSAPPPDGGGGDGGSGGGELPGGGTPQPGSPTTMALIDFVSSHQYARPVVQRRAGTEYGNVPVLFNYTGNAPGNPQARVVAAVGGAVVKDWTTLTDINVTGSTGVGTLPGVPQGGYYLLELRDGNSPGTSGTNSSGTKRWGVGVCVLAVGQSNMIRTLGAGSYEDIVPGSSPAQNEYDYWMGGKSAATLFGTSGFYHNNGNGAPGGGSSAPALGGGTFSVMRILANALAAKYGKLVPVGFIPWAESGKDIGELSPDGAVSSPLFNNSGTAAGSMGLKSPGNIYPGDFEGMVWHQGESSNSRDRANYLQALKDLYTNLLSRVAPFGRTAEHLFFLPAILGVYESVTNVESKRAAVLDLDAYARANNWPRVRAGWNCLDLDPGYGASDGLHFDDHAGGPQYRRWSAKRMTQALLYALGCSAFTGLGPRISGATRSGNVVTITVTHDGGSTLTLRNSGAAITGWSVKDASGADVAGIAVAIASANTVTVTVPNGTAFPVKIQHGGGMNPDVSNLIVDDKAYPEGCTGVDLITNGRPLLPTPDPIEVA